MTIKSRKFKLIIILVVIAGAAGFAALRVVFRRSAAEAQTWTVRSETFTNIIEIAGTISAAKEQKLQAAGTGTVTAVFVTEGDTIRSGDRILKLDDAEQRYNLAKLDYDIAQRQISGSPRELALMRTQRDVLIQRIKDREIIANFNGVIAEFTAAVGDVFEAKDSVGVIVDRSYLTATVEVAETDAPKLRAGQKVTLKFPALANEPVEGRVFSFPAMAAKSNRGASVVKAEIRVDDPPDLILPNYSFTGEIEISPPVTLLLVERWAIGWEDVGGAERENAAAREGGIKREGSARRESGAKREGNAGREVTALESRTAFVEKINPDGGTERTAVQVEPYGAEFVKIISGLAEGDVLKTQQRQRVSGGARQTRQQNGAQGQRRQQPGFMISPGPRR